MKEIKDIIEEYRSLPPNYQNINKLIYMRQMLAGYFYNLCEEMGLQKQIHNSTKVILETHKSFARVESINRGTSATEANTQSRASTTRQFKEVQEAEAEYLKLFYMYKGADAVLNAMSQQISTLRSELEKSNFQV